MIASTFRHLLTIWLACLGLAQAAPQLLDLGFENSTLLLGEKSSLIIKIAGKHQLQFIAPATVNDFDFESVITEELPASATETLLRIPFRPLKLGSLSLPPIEILVDEEPLSLPSRTLLCLDPSSLVWQTQGGLSFATRWFFPRPTPFVNEEQVATLSLYLPKSFFQGASVFAKLPRFQHLGFKLSQLEFLRPDAPAEPNGEVILNRVAHWVFCYRFKLTPIAADASSLGPLSLELEYEQHDEALGIPRLLAPKSLLISILPSPIKVRPLPDSAKPQTLVASELSLKLFPPIAPQVPGSTIDFRLKLSAPDLPSQIPFPEVDPTSGWVLKSQQVLKRQGSSAEFQFLLQHPETPEAAPVFSLQSFDPISQQLQRIHSNPASLSWTAQISPKNTVTSANSPSPMLVPKAAPQASLFRFHARDVLLPQTLLLASVPLFALFFFGWYRRRQRHPIHPLKSALKRLSPKSPTAEFLREAAKLIETHLPPTQRPEAAQQLIQLRDDLAFLPPAQAQELPLNQKRDLLKSLQKALLCLFLFSLYASTSLQAANSADAFTLAGNAAFNAQDFPQASLAYRLALQENPRHFEARHNLQSLHQSQALPDPLPAWPTPLFSLSQLEWLAAAVMFFYLTLLFALAAFAWRLRRLKSVSFLCLLFALTSFSLFWLFPKTHPLARSSSQCLPTSEHAVLYASPIADPEQVTITLPPLACLHVLAHRDQWLFVSYVDPANQAWHAWIPRDKTLPIQASSLLFYPNHS